MKLVMKGQTGTNFMVRLSSLYVDKCKNIQNSKKWINIFEFVYIQRPQYQSQYERVMNWPRIMSRKGSETSHRKLAGSFQGQTARIT